MSKNRPPPFDEKDKIKMLLWSERHCCLCNKPCDTNIEIHHIEREGRTDEELSNIDNAIPLCFDCHGKIKSYNPKHAVGTSYKIEEIKARREQIYDKYTRLLVPLVNFSIEQGSPEMPTPFPTVITYVAHNSPSLPVRARIEIKHLLGTIDKKRDLGIMQDTTGYYSGQTLWHLNPMIQFHGNYTVPEECITSISEDLWLEARLTIIDEYGRPHKMLPQAWKYVRKERYWFLEPTAFTEWI
jgi:hypothetical protein